MFRTNMLVRADEVVEANGHCHAQWLVLPSQSWQLHAMEVESVDSALPSSVANADCDCSKGKSMVARLQT